MSVARATTDRAPRQPSRPTATATLAAILVVIALAALAGYAMFSGPTPIPASAVRTTPPQAPAHTFPGDERERGGDR